MSTEFRFSGHDERLLTGTGIREKDVIRIDAARGTALYGPYIDLPAGDYEAIIHFDPSVPCNGIVLMDVCAGYSSHLLAQILITAHHIRSANMMARLEFSCPSLLSQIEVRLQALFEEFSGAIQSVEIKRLLSLRSEFDTHNDIRETLRLLRPFEAKDVVKSRFGSANDGGYVLLEDFQGIDTVFSFGIDHNASWDIDMANRGLTVYQFDHTVNAPVMDNPRLIFAQKKIAAERSIATESLASLITYYDKNNDNPNLLLKIDIEINEWEVLDSTPSELLNRFSQIVGEFHYFESLGHPEWRKIIKRVLSKLNENYSVVHVHANNYASVSNIANVIFPNVLEITFANRSLYSLSESNELFPGPLDAPCNPLRPDLYLGSFRF